MTGDGKRMGIVTMDLQLPRGRRSSYKDMSGAVRKDFGSRRKGKSGKIRSFPTPWTGVSLGRGELDLSLNDKQRRPSAGSLRVEESWKHLRESIAGKQRNGGVSGSNGVAF